MFRRAFRLPLTGHRLARELDEELAFHLQTRVERLVAGGMPPDEARREAFRQFGDLNAVRQSCLTIDHQRERAMHRAHVASEIRQDLAYAGRVLRHNPGFTVMVVAALAIGIGANTAIFTLVDSVLLRPLPVPHPEQLVAVGDPTRVNSHSGGSPRTDILSAPVYRAVRAQNHLFSGVLATGRAGRLDVRIESGSSELEHPRGRFVSGNYFSVLGVSAVAGRTFDATADSTRGGAPVTTISYGYWVRRFHRDPAIIGRQIIIDDLHFTIVGVTPSSFTGAIVGQAPDVWLPLEMHDALRPHERNLDDLMQNWLLLIGRLKPGATLAQARQEIPPIVTRTIVANTPAGIGTSFGAARPKVYVSSAARGLSRVRSDFGVPLLTLMAGVAFLLGIICINVANLLLARAIARGREMSVRLALGADRGRLVRQLLTESVFLATLGAVLGLLLALAASRWLLVMASDGAAISLDLRVNGTVLSFTILSAVVAVVLFGVLPALRASRVDLAASMRANAHSVTGGALGGRGQRRPLGMLLIVGQVALSVVVLVCAAMLARSLHHLETLDVGVDRDHLVIADLDIGARGLVGTPLANLVHTLRDRLAALPGVASVTYSENGIFSGSDNTTNVEVPGFAARAPSDSEIHYDNVGPGYMAAVGARLLQGRDLDAGDENKPARVAVVNRSLADFYFPHESAIGKYIHFSDSIAVRIVGVIADARDRRLEGLPPRRMYFPYVHTDTNQSQLGNPGGLRLEVRAVGDPGALTQAIRRAVVATDPSLPIDGIDPLATLIRQSIREERLLAHLATAFGMLALAFAAIGLYGVMSYAVTRRTGEIGLRTALGARRRDIVWLVLSDALSLVLVGCVIGVPLALALARLLGAELHGIGAADPASIVIAVAVLAASASVAATLPALRASRLPPTLALRED